MIGVLKAIDAAMVAAEEVLTRLHELQTEYYRDVR